MNCNYNILLFTIAVFQGFKILRIHFFSNKKIVRMYIFLFKYTIVCAILSIVSVQYDSQFVTEINNFYYFPTGFV